MIISRIPLTKEYLQDRFINRGWSYNQIYKESGWSKACINETIGRFGLRRKRNLRALDLTGRDFIDLNKELYLNTGWSVGGVYDAQVLDYWRTGPETTLQYYVGDCAFLYSGANYDIVSEGENGFRWSFGVGLTF